ncbi:uncharacterized protein LOC122260376, partial [Penaeus japonicus]|uniref:uncharacterized protein LOC122260376 n=1 Tax=Penaeus japonicus TaxID=27405 RepID=UPI001C71398B
PYVFAYSITDPRNGADFGQAEESDGSVVSGQYHVLLPDGRRQNRNRNRNRDQLKPYVFAYSITDPRNGADFGQAEESDGSVVSGQYHVLLPDGRRQMVHYRADPVNGFVSEVEYLENHLPGSGGFPFPSTSPNGSPSATGYSPSAAPRSQVPSDGSLPSDGLLHGEIPGDTPYHLPTAGDQIQSPSILSISRSKPPLELLSHLPTRAHAAGGNPRKTTIEVPSVGSTGQEPTAGSPVVRQLPSQVARFITGGDRRPTWRSYFEN